MANEKALEAFIEKRHQIKIALFSLQTMSEDMFGIHPEDVNWSEVASLEAVSEKLNEALSFLKGEAQ